MKTGTTFEFRRYVALGDSISIDEYPGLDWQELHGLPAPAEGLGAVSLLYRNDDEAWPEFRGKDLATLYPGIELDSLPVDGGVTSDVLADQLPQLGHGDTRPTLVTLTVGGNDLLQLLRPDSGPPRIGDADRILSGVETILDKLAALFPERRVLLGTVYDPSDGDAQLMGLPLGPGERALLDRVNEGIRDLGARKPDVLLADIAVHFDGHGLSAPSTDRWYWPHMIIEPSARGASEVRRLWLRGIGVQVAGQATSTV
jgi:lysophospholipase L1-like esterase